MSKASTPTPIALPNDLSDEIEQAASALKMTKQDVMRLSMRIGLIDLRAAKDIAGVVQELATAKGESFLAWARQNAAGQLQQADLEIEESTIQAAGQQLKLIQSKSSFTGHPESLQEKQASCSQPETAPAAHSTSPGLRRGRPPKLPANAVRLPTGPWSTADSKVAEIEAPGSSTAARSKKERKGR